MRFRMLFAGMSAFCLYVGGWAQAQAQDKWQLTTAQFKTEAVELKQFDASGAKFSPAGGGPLRTLPMDDFLDLSRTLPAASSSGKFELHMTGGDRLGGEPVALKAESMVWKNAALGEISIPTSRLVAITPPGKDAPSERSHEDLVKLANGDTVSGIIASMTPDSVTVQTAAGNSAVPLSSVASVNFAATPGGADTRPAFRVRLDDGSSLVCAAVKLEGESLILTLAKNTDRKVPLGHVTTIEQVNGPVSWLSSRVPSEALYYPFMGPARQPAAYMDQTWGGRGAIEYMGRTFAHGIGVHAKSSLSWTLNGNYAAFRTRYAINGDSTLADATVRIKLDDRVAYQKLNVRAGALSPVVVLDLSGAKKLTLEVDSATPSYPQDSFNWIEPALLLHKPTPEPAVPEKAEQSATRPATTSPTKNQTDAPSHADGDAANSH